MTGTRIGQIMDLSTGSGGLPPVCVLALGSSPFVKSHGTGRTACAFIGERAPLAGGCASQLASPIIASNCARLATSSSMTHKSPSRARLRAMYSA